MKEIERRPDNHFRSSDLVIHREYIIMNELVNAGAELTHEEISSSVMN